MNLMEDFFLKNFNHTSECFRYLNILSMIYLSFLLAATVVAYKIVIIWTFVEPGSTLIYTFTFFLGNIIAEVYGRSKAQKLIWESIISGYIFAILITLVSNMPSPTSWDLQFEVNKAFGNILRFTNAGVVGYLLSSFLNAYLITKWKYKLKGQLFWLRSLLATSLSEFVATFIAGFITFFGIMPTEKVFLLMLHAFLFKIIYGFIAVWPASFFTYILKIQERKFLKENKKNYQLKTVLDSTRLARIK